MIGFLGGLPGAGKSQVIKALQMLASNWDSSAAIGTIAYQGVAAQAANGQTLHKFFGWGLHSRNKRRQYSAQQRERFARLKMLIIDEVSIMDSGFLGMADAALREIKGTPDRLFGGLHVLFVGDWLQQLPVAGCPAYSVPDPARDASKMRHCDAKKYFDRIRGNQVYEKVNYVVMLDENMRHRNDPEWRDILNRWRVGEYLESDIETVNARCFRENWTVSVNHDDSFCPIIVTSNALRSEFNTECAVAFCKEKKQILHDYPAFVTRAKRLVTGTDRRSLNTIRDDKTGNMAMRLRIAIGMPVQCTKNVSLVLGIANGLIGHVVELQDSPTDTVNTAEADGVTHAIHSEVPEIVFIQLRGHEERSFVSELPAGVVPIRPWRENSVEVAIRERRFSIGIRQAPLVPAFSLTSEKCQGLTVRRMVLAPLRRSTRWSPQKSSFYVAVTRVTSMAELFLTEKLTLEYLSYFTPEPGALAETARLCALETLPP